MPLLRSLMLASDATWLGLAAGACLLFALVAWLGEWRRARRSHLDAVGCMPWSTLSVLALFVGLVLLSIAAGGWLRG
jgi:hypothetical protein